MHFSSRNMYMIQIYRPLELCFSYSCTGEKIQATQWSVTKGYLSAGERDKFPPARIRFSHFPRWQSWKLNIVNWLWLPPCDLFAKLYHIYLHIIFYFFNTMFRVSTVQHDKKINIFFNNTWKQFLYNVRFNEI